jgi:hypothetical protein
MTQPQRILNTIADPKARHGYHHLCAILRAAAPSGPGDSQPHPRRTAMRHQKPCEIIGYSSPVACPHPQPPTAPASIPHRIT